jgi:hypothetical protein
VSFPMRSASIDKDARGISLPLEQVESYLTNSWPAKTRSRTEPVFTAVAQGACE